ncbi:hypothetical protein ACFPT7_20865 [Acidicapsa dinghuensis]|uniref:Lipoprotein n=1 Tax=Acidicapsa dinghuensis TaxID=2218256 RepID=A0ABW1EMZ0_9BACT|nr:hypothetical protein [Acidicapsa dinghuensis]
MKFKSCRKLAASMLPLLAILCGCRGHGRQDTVLSTASNLSQTWRATVILRGYFVDGKLDKSPATFVLLDKDSGKPNYENGQDFLDSQTVIKASDCGPLAVQWIDDSTLKVICNRCGLALSAVGQHPSLMGAVRVQYDGFPAVSSWEGGSSSN